MAAGIHKEPVERSTVASSSCGTLANRLTSLGGYLVEVLVPQRCGGA